MSLEQYNNHLKEWCNLSQFTTLFDSETEELTARSIYSKIAGKTHIYFIVEDEEGNMFGSYHNFIPQRDTMVGYEDDPNHFVFTLHNPHGIEPTKYTTKENNSDILHTYDDGDINNVLNIQHAYGITSDSRVFIYESIIYYYNNIPEVGPRLLVNNANRFFGMKRFVIIQMN